MVQVEEDHQHPKHQQQQLALPKDLLHQLAQASGVYSCPEVVVVLGMLGLALLMARCGDAPYLNQVKGQKGQEQGQKRGRAAEGYIREDTQKLVGQCVKRNKGALLQTLWRGAHIGNPNTTGLWRPGFHTCS